MKAAADATQPIPTDLARPRRRKRDTALSIATGLLALIVVAATVLAVIVYLAT